METKLPLGGFILRGIVSMSTFYIGGYHINMKSDHQSVYELVDSQWNLLGVKLEVGVTGWDATILESQLNLTMCQ